MTYMWISGLVIVKNIGCKHKIKTKTIQLLIEINPIFNNLFILRRKCYKKFSQALCT